MKKTDYLLSICVPTFNREVPLRRLMESVVSQEAFFDDVCIVVTDGNSSDGTATMMSEFVKLHDNVFFYQTPTNTGMRKALLEASASTKWTYTWLVWSDDQLAPGAIASMLSALRSWKEPALVLGNLHPYSSEEEKTAYVSESGYETFEGFVKLAEYMGSDKYDKDRYGFEQHFTFMSVFCFDADYFAKALDKSIADVGLNYLNENYFNFIYVVFSSLHDRNIILLSGDTILLDWANDIAWRPNMKIPKDLSELFEMINRTYLVPKSFEALEIKMTSYVYMTMKKVRFITPVALYLKKIWLYNIARKIWLSLQGFKSKA